MYTTKNSYERAFPFCLQGLSRWIIQAGYMPLYLLCSKETVSSSCITKGTKMDSTGNLPKEQLHLEVPFLQAILENYSGKSCQYMLLSAKERWVYRLLTRH